MGLDLYFWYKLREEKRKQLPKYGKKNIVDYFILFLLADLALCMVMSMAFYLGIVE